MRGHGLILSVVCVLSVMLVAGCAGMGKKATPEELVMQQTKAFADDFVAGNVDKILGYASEDFHHEKVADKKTLAEHINKAKEQGKIPEYTQMIKDHHGQINLDQAKVTVKGDKATVYPVVASADEGSVTVELQFKKDKDGVWRIETLNIEGI